MTICAAAFACNSEAIVCVADKALTFGELITWESDSTKLIQLPQPGCVAMMSGEEEGIPQARLPQSAKRNTKTA